MNKAMALLWAVSYLVSVGVVHAAFYSGAGLGGGALLLGYGCLFAFFSLASGFALFHWRLGKRRLPSLFGASALLIGELALALLTWQASAAVTLQGVFPALSLLNLVVILKAGFSVPGKFYGLLLVPYWAAMALWLWPSSL